MHFRILNVLYGKSVVSMPTSSHDRHACISYGMFSDDMMLIPNSTRTDQLVCVCVCA